MINILQKSFLFLILISTYCFSQKGNLDVIELNNNEVYEGKVQKIRILTVEFKDMTTYIDYEFEKKDIRYIKLSNGKVIYFDKNFTDKKKASIDDSKSIPKYEISKEENHTESTPPDQGINSSDSKINTYSKLSILINGGYNVYDQSNEENKSYSIKTYGGGLDFYLSRNFSFMLYFNYWKETTVREVSNISFLETYTIPENKYSIMSFWKLCTYPRYVYAFVGAGIVNIAGSGIINEFSKGKISLCAGVGLNLHLTEVFFIFLQSNIPIFQSKTNDNVFIPILIGVGFDL